MLVGRLWKPFCASSRVLLLLSLPCGCARESDSPDEKDTPRVDSDVGIEDSNATIWLVDEAKARGVTGENHCGDPLKKRYLLETIGNGCALFDYDGDCDLDLYVVDGCTLVPPDKEDCPSFLVAGEDWRPGFDGQSRLYENDGRGFFEDVTPKSGASFRGFGVGASAADYDGDVDVDLYVTCWGPNLLFRNNGDRTFTEVGRQAGVADDRWSIASCWFDAENDGDLDFYVTNYFAMTVARDPDCWRKVDCPFFDLKTPCGPKGMVPEPGALFQNHGDGTFLDASVESGIHAAPNSYGLGAVAFDFERDGDADLYVANDSRANYLFVNDGAGHFEECADLLGAALNRDGIAQAGMGIGCGDYDGDTDLDLFLTNFSHDNNTLYRNEGTEFLDVTFHSGFPGDVYYALGWGAEFADFDNDGDLELFVANGHIYPEADVRAPELNYKDYNRLYVIEQGKFVDVTFRSGPGMSKKSSTRGAAVGDLDNDGDLDLVLVEQNEAPTLLINQRRDASRQSVTLLLQGVNGNSSAIGAEVVAECGPRRMLRVVRSGHSYACGGDPRLHFGLDREESLSRATVRWPDGGTQTAEGLKPGFYRWRQGEMPAEIER